MNETKPLKLNVRFNLLLVCLLVGLFLLTAFLTYRNQKELARNVALEQSRSAARELNVIFQHMSAIVEDEPETNYQLVPQVVSTQIAKKISAGDRYTIRQVSLKYRNPDNQPDLYEKQQLNAFIEGRQSDEVYRVIDAGDQETFRYLKALPAEQSCLKCHGDFDAAPTYIQERFPREHQSYNYQRGDIIGAISVIRPLDDLYGKVAENLRRELYYRAAILLLVVVMTWLFVRRLVIAPLQITSDTIHRITRTGNLEERIPVQGKRDEIGQLQVDFNTMMSELDRTTLQRQESEDRYRSLIEAAQSAIVTFLENGKIVLSNRQAEALCGLSRSGLLGESFYDFLEDPGRLKEKVAACAQAGPTSDFQDTSRYRFIDRTGDSRELDITLVLASAVENTPMFTAILREPEPPGQGRATT